MASSSESLCLVWHAHGVRVLTAPPAGSGPPAPLPLLEWAEGASPDEDTTAAGQASRDALDRAGLRQKQALVVVPRRGAVVRTLPLPAVPDNELPDLVRLQVAARSVIPVDSLAVDFQTCPTVEFTDDTSAGNSTSSASTTSSPTGGTTATAGTQRVLAASLPLGTLEQITAVLLAAGLELERVLLGSSCLTAQAIGSPSMSDGSGRLGSSRTGVLVAIDSGQAEFLFIRGNELQFSHVCQLPYSETPSAEGTARAISAEIRRAAIPAGVGNPSDADIVILGPPLAAGTQLADLVQSTLSCSAHAIDPLASASLPEATDSTRIDAATSLGAGLLASRPPFRPVDFLHPRRPVVRQDNRRARWLVAALAAVVLLAGSWWWFSSYQQSLDRQIADLEQQVADIDAVLKRGEPTLASIAEVDQWLSRRRLWLTELVEFAKLQSGRDRLYFDRILLLPSSATSDARVRATGFARTRADVEDLQQKLAIAGFRIQPQPVRRSDRSAAYPWRFELDLAAPQDAADSETTARTAHTSDWRTPHSAEIARRYRIRRARHAVA